jgi:hypothetical protein
MVRKIHETKQYCAQNSGEHGKVNSNTVEQWKDNLAGVCKGYKPVLPEHN